MADDLLPEPELTEPDDRTVEDNSDSTENTYDLLSENEFDDALTALETYPDEQESDMAELFPDQEQVAQEAEIGQVDDEDRLRLPRAQLFRHRLRNQITMLPLALFLLALGVYLIARRQDVKGLPDLSSQVLAVVSILLGAFTLVFRALVSGRQERGLLLLGVWVWITAGMLFVLIYGIDRQADAARWWPLLLWSLGMAFVVVYPVERTHDTRLLWLGVIILTAGGVAYAVTSDRIDDQSLRDAAEYWPLLLSVLGVGLLPLAFRRMTEQDQ